SARYPENTLLAFRQAIRAGADGIELDVHGSSDHTLVVHHNYGVKEASGRFRYIFDMHSDEIRALEIGHESGHGVQRVPLLEEVFEECGDAVAYEIELKGLTSEFLTAVVRLVKDSRLLHKVEFTSWHFFLLALLRQWEPDATIGLFVAPFPGWMPADLGDAIVRAHATVGGMNIVHYACPMLTPACVTHLHDAGLQVYAANCNSTEDLERAFALGVDRLSTDHVDLAVRVRTARQT
ncbi:MAG: glycerophosphodiester phosphodiesterase, partial [Candidatus Latescibacteria bacterium]|nr:glycerophosphodiester phosphodiesterase [Candidatus Latescibacterota bacterium]